MDESERLSCIIALQHELEQQHHKGLDFLVSSFAAACKCHRRASVCRPFPSHLLFNNDYAAVSAALDALPSLSAILSEDRPQTSSSNSSINNSSSSSNPTDLQLGLLQWLLLQLQLKRDCDLSPISAEQLQAELQAGGSCPPGLLHHLRGCRCILRLNKPGQQQPSPGSCVAAFHGTDFANIHSILHNGLLAASGTRLQTTGAVFGVGIYLSTDFNVAYSFSKAQQGWAGSSIGRHLRCVLLCEVSRDVLQQGQSSGTAQGSSSLPERYILVPKPADVAVTHLLVFADDVMLGLAAGGSGRRRHRGAATCLTLTLAYVVAMLLLAAWQTHRSWR